MKVSERMKKVLLFLLHPEKTFPWFRENKFEIFERDYYEEWYILSFCAKKPVWDFTHSERISYRRTLGIMMELGLINWELPSYHPSYKLTDKGRELAEKIEKEIRDSIKEYEYLV